MKKDKEVQVQNEQFSRLILCLEGIYVILGVILIILPQIRISHICYVLGAILVIAGITLIVHYFMTEAYRNLNEYGFSIGALLVILGVCSLVRNKDVAGVFPSILGIFILFTAIIKIQNALDLYVMNNKAWIFFLGIAVIISICAIVILLNPFSTVSARDLFLDLVLAADGVIGILERLYLSVHVHKYNKDLRNSTDPAIDLVSDGEEDLLRAFEESLAEPQEKETGDRND